MSKVESRSDAEVFAGRGSNLKRLFVPFQLGAWISLIAWLLLFAGGAVIETLPSRVALSPVSSMQIVKGEVLASIYAKTLYSDPKNKDSSAGEKAVDEKAIREKLIKWSSGLEYDKKIGHFILCVLFYTPVNLAVLSFVSGMLGGYLSNLYACNLKSRGIEIEHKERLKFLEEPPLTSAIRGFLAYVCFIAGVYIVINDPFVDTSASQYLKIAGTMSAVAFSFGYDPTKIGALLKVIPGGGDISDKEASKGKSDPS
jgi:hypothetical protein